MNLMEKWLDAARQYLPVDAAVWDAHTHTGQNDPDGVRGTADRLLAKLDEAGQAGAAVVTNRDPDGYPDPNDRVLAEANQSSGRLVPYLRVDPRLGTAALAEVERCLEAGHRGIKLHPRAEQFELSNPTVRRVAELAAERGVPMLVHAGRGIPSLGEDAVRLCDAVDGLRVVLAHAAISDLSWLGPAVADHPGLYFDTSWWDVTDLLALFAWVPPGRILYASDTPYGHPALGFILTMRVAASARYNSSQLRALFGGTLLRLLDGEEGEELGPAPGDDFVGGDPGLLRVHASLHGAIVRAFSRDDASEQVSLARLACVVPADAHHEPVYRAIAGTLDNIDLVNGARRDIVRPLIVAAAGALTPDVAVPDIA
ncbi:MAG: amidohydrolase family protein [Acidimicrobiia bacterium]